MVSHGISIVGVFMRFGIKCFSAEICEIYDVRKKIPENSKLVP